jgi:hypothetical protein
MFSMKTTGVSNLLSGQFLLKYENFFIGFILALGAIFVFMFSIWQGLYNVDPHHWGLMFSNAVDLTRGKIPYKDIFIQYGILTTIIHAIGYVWLTQSLVSIIAITAFAYVCGLLGMYFLSYSLTKSKRIALLTFVSCVIFHPLTIYPWSNYISFPFLVFGLMLLVRGGGRWYFFWLSGSVFSCAILARENLSVAILVFSFIVSTIVIADKSIARRNKVQLLGGYWVGLLAPLIIFFAALEYFEIVQYWYEYSIKLPRLYAKLFLGDGILSATENLFRSIANLNVRGKFLLLLIASCVAFWCAYIARLKSVITNPIYDSRGIFLISTLALLLLSSALHLTEIFRLATGTIIGMPVLFILVSRFNVNYKSNRIRVDSVLFVVFAIWSAVHLVKNQPLAGNYFLPKSEDIAKAVVYEHSRYFKHQRWPAESIKYYDEIESDLMRIAGLSCHIQYLRNNTKDAFISVLSPFIQYQTAPFGKGMHDFEAFNNLRPDYRIEEKIQAARDIVIVTSHDVSDNKQFTPPEKFYVFGKYITPKSFFFRETSVTYVLVPTYCDHR